MGKIAQALGKTPMPHQQYLWDVAFEIDPNTGRFAYSEVTMVGPRQVTGKTEQILPVMVHRCTGVGVELVKSAMAEYGIKVPEPGPQRVFFTAQTADDARLRWRDTHVARISKSPLADLWSSPPRLTQNKESMFWRNGSSWAPGSTTGKTAGTGDTIDLGVIDEAWSRVDNRTEMGMRPAMMTRPWSQLWALSMVPGPSKVGPEEWPWLKQRMLTGRQRVKSDQRRGRCYIEFGAPDDADPADPETWWASMPGLGFTVPEDRVQEDFEGFSLDDFKAEYLGIWPTGEVARWTTITKTTWDGLLDQVTQHDEPIALGLDGNPELTSSSISMAAQRFDGDVNVELIDRRSGVNWLIDAVLAICRKQSVCAVGIDDNGPLAGLITPLTRAAVEANLDITIVRMNSKQVSAACGDFYNMTGETDDAQAQDVQTTRRVHHIGQPELDQSVGGAIQHFHGDRWRWDRVNSTADTGPVFSATLALGAGDDQEWLGGAYDMRESLG